MEKYLRLLNPKTTNFDAIGGGNHGMLTCQDVCVALSYAKLTIVQTELFKTYALKQNSVDQLKLSAKIILQEISKTRSFPVIGDVELSIYIALVELCAVPANYKPSERNRAVVGNVSRMQIQRKLSGLIDQYKSYLKNEIEKIGSKLDYQILKNT